MTDITHPSTPLFRALFQALRELRDNNILINSKDITCQLGEWLVASIYGGRRAESATQKGWDVDVNGWRIQVKAHAKAPTNGNRLSRINTETVEKADEVIIVVFTESYHLKEFYQVPWLRAVEKKKGNKLCWDDLTAYSRRIDTLPGQDIIRIFSE